MQIKILFLPGDWPLIWELCNCDMRFSMCFSDKAFMYQRYADETVVAVKPGAWEDAVTYLRVKLSTSDSALSRIGGEGRNMFPRFDVFIRNYRCEISP